MERRQLGRTGHMSSVVAFGSAALARIDQKTADLAIDLALERGVNHFDVAPLYGDAELRLGPWLSRIRDQVFLGCKTKERTYQAAWEQLQRSLDRLQTDRLDLYQLHAVGRLSDFEEATAPGGAIEALLRAREEGLTRWLGITGHYHDAPATFLQALERVDFDTVMFPLNFVLWSLPDYRRDAERLLARCRERNVGVQVIKTLAKDSWESRARTHTTWYEPFDDQPTIDHAVAFVLSQPVATLASSGDVGLLPKIFDAADRFRPMSADEQAELLSTASGYHSPFVGAWA